MTTDLNLIRTFVAIYETRSVSAAARRLSITQPSVSYSLNRLRDLLQDPLFTRTRDGMVPTFNATQLFNAFKSALDSIETAISTTRQFDPTGSNRCFRLALSDLGELHFLPFLVRELQAIAPSVELEIVQIDSERITEWLQTGSVDAVVGNLQFVGGQVRKKALFTESYSCLLSPTHPSIGNAMTLADYVSANHVVVAPFTGHHLVEDVMGSMGLTRKISLRVPHFTSLVAVIATTDLVLTLPTRIARSFASDGRMRVLPLPLEIPPFEVNLYWYPHAEDSAAQQWFCDTIAQCLSDV
ncbi:LysR family transcriptional regulator [Paraburkholderia hospita]|uniref:LysR family transcriptional regulator n=1 Tax=Paraburkholderia hospita TaxID=169430 RepID=A0AAN1MPU5_9BURK|nr:LysR family transcriptional regulator [Paraburkholderia hospita]AUT75083.1 LysR family transcriptional regulator [Paraburkholderia hospita]EIM93265.1 LysR family transcriptional regulator [Paraburkholderia hospita]OUL87249.1 LysR family transcriptional regulator [Paraburkholderia hospita]OUL89829.1 LysR family transcriptional regulator [Paraburkholderia hospita]SEH84932.1 transcriptional regulator, LysR family [Paraburkholderia hospita]